MKLRPHASGGLRVYGERTSPAHHFQRAVDVRYQFQDAGGVEIVSGAEAHVLGRLPGTDSSVAARSGCSAKRRLA